VVVLLLVQLNVFKRRTARLENSQKLELGCSCSFRGKTTRLVKLANQISTNPSRRKWICLRLENKSHCLIKYGIAGTRATSNFTGAQVGMSPRQTQPRANLHIQPERVERT